jgi:hypothetical protein
VAKQGAFHDRLFVKLRMAEELDFRPHIIFSERQIEAGLGHESPRQAKHISEMMAWVLCAMAFTMMRRSEIWAA